MVARAWLPVDCLELAHELGDARQYVMADEPANSGDRHDRDDRGRWRKGVSGNPAGPATGTRNRATKAAEALLDGDAERLTRKAVEMALEGDTTALRLCMERILPARKDRPVAVALPPMERAGDVVAGHAALAEAVAAGELTPSEATDLARVLEGYGKALELNEIESRLQELEQRLDRQDSRRSSSDE